MTTIESLTGNLNLADRFAGAWRLFKVSLGVVRDEPALIGLTLIALVTGIVLPLASLALLVALLIPAGLSTLTAGPEVATASSSFLQLVLVVLGGFAIYRIFLSSVIGAFFNGAVAEVAMRRMEGQNPSVGDGLGAARKRFGALAVFGLVTGFVRVLTSMSFGSGNTNTIANSMTSAAQTIVAELYRLLTSLSLPVIMREPVSGTKAIGRSTEIVRKVWPQAIASGFGVRAITGLFSAIPMLVAIGAFAIVFTGMPSVETAPGEFTITGDLGAALAPLVPLFAGCVLLSFIFGRLGGLLEAVYNAALYLYATTGKAGDFDASDLAKAAITSDGVVKPGAAK